MNQLTITLPYPAPPGAAQVVYDYATSVDGTSVQRHASVAAALLPRERGQQVIALVPGAALSWHQVTLPKGTLGQGLGRTSSPARVRNVLEGLLEEQLLDDPAQLHFALQPQARNETPVWVAVCDKAWLQSSVQALQDAGLALSQIVPEWAPALSQEQGADVPLYATGVPEDAYWVWTSPGGVHRLPMDAHSTALAQTSGAATAWAEPAIAAQAQELLLRDVRLQTPAQRSILAAQSTWDLAQLDLTLHNQQPALRQLRAATQAFVQAPRWRAARACVLAIVLIHIAGLNAWAWRERSALGTQRAAIASVLTSSFPQVQVVVDAPLQMAREVASLRQASGAVARRDMDALLSAFGAAAPAHIAPTAIEYVAGELRLRGPVLPPEPISALNDALQAQGLRAQQEGDALVVREATP